MKTIFSTVILSLITLTTMGQERKFSQLYLSTEYISGQFSGVQASAAFSKNGRFQYHIGLRSVGRIPATRPDNYHVPIFERGVMDEWTSLNIGASRIIPLNHKRTIRLNLSIAVGVGYHKEPTAWEQTFGNPFEENYNYDIRKSTSGDFFLNPKLEMPFSRHFGIVVAPGISANTKHGVHFAPSAGIIFGRLRPRSR